MPGAPRVARLDAAHLLDRVRAAGGPRLTLLGSLPGGEVGAALVALPSGRTAVLSSWPGHLGERAPVVRGIVDRLRARGYPAPAYLAVVDCGDVTAVVQERVAGTPVARAGPGLVRALLAVHRLQRGALEAAGGSPADLHLLHDGPGFCLHGPLRHHSRATRGLLDRVHEVGRATPPGVLSGHDAVHLDLHPGNVLVVPGTDDRIAGVVDWTGARAGDCGLDLVTLGFALDHDGAPAAARSAVQERIAAEVGAAALRAFAAHMALRQVDWAVRHHGPADVERWLAVSTRWLDSAQ